MSKHTLLLAILPLLACQTSNPDASPDVPVAVAMGPAPTFDLTQTEGYLPEDHVEVAPGIFVLSHLVDSGEVTYTDLRPADGSLTGIPAAGSTLPPPPAPTDGGDGAGSGEGDSSGEDDGGSDGGARPGRDYCYNYDTDYYNDSTSNGTLFGGDPSWYAYASAYSYKYGTYRANQVYTYVSSIAPDTIGYVYSYAYVYINDRYVGYAYEYNYPGRYAYAYGSWGTRCPEGETMSVSMNTYHYFSDYPGGSLSVGNTLSAEVACCGG